MTDEEWNRENKVCDQILSDLKGVNAFRVSFTDASGIHQRDVRAYNARQAIARVLKYRPREDDIFQISAQPL